MNCSGWLPLGFTNAEFFRNNKMQYRTPLILRYQKLYHFCWLHRIAYVSYSLSSRQFGPPNPCVLAVYVLVAWKYRDFFFLKKKPSARSEYKLRDSSSDRRPKTNGAWESMPVPTSPESSRIMTSPSTKKGFDGKLKRGGLLQIKVYNAFKFGVRSIFRRGSQRALAYHPSAQQIRFENKVWVSRR